MTATNAVLGFGLFATIYTAYLLGIDAIYQDTFAGTLGFSLFTLWVVALSVAVVFKWARTGEV